MSSAELGGRRQANSRAERAGLAKIAEKVGVSESTISRVINRRRGVGQATREAVEKALRGTEYDPRTRPTLVLIVMPGLTNAFFSNVAEAIAAHLHRAGLRVVVGAVSGAEQEQDYVEAMIDGDLAAVVFLSASNTLHHSPQAVLGLLKARRIPYVAVNGAFEGDRHPVFSTDDLLAADLAVQHLVELGHRRIGMIAGPAGNTPSDLRVEGFRAACLRYQLDPAWTPAIHGQYVLADARNATERLLGYGATAIVAASDVLALGAVQVAHEHGLAVPTDVSVIGYDDADFLDHTHPPLTTIAQPVELLAENTARSVASLLAHEQVPRGETRLAPRLHLRGSTGIAPKAK